MDFPESAVEEQVDLSREDLRFMDMATKSVKHIDGHYQVVLPLRNLSVSMPKNKKVVEQRLCHLKRRLQRDLCRREVGWDVPIPEAVSKEWLKGMQGLHLLDNFELHRCLKALEFGDVITAQLHHFCDVCEDGYGTVTYLIVQNENHQMHSAFIMGKACVAPLKTVTIPRMELIAATMASHMDVLWKKEHHMSLQESVFWTDSASVLKYIRNETTRFKVFVANCVSETLKSSHPSQWRYVDTASNPADAASRGVKVEVFLKDRLWLTGPRFLCQPEIEWPLNPEPVSPLSQDDPEVKKSAVINAVQIGEDSTTHLIHYSSSWIQLKKAVAWWLKYKEWLLSCSRKRKQLTASQSEVSMEQQRRWRQVQYISDLFWRQHKDVADLYSDSVF
ncbi:uncharacterized protein LOC115417609 [Sphaeramia orbicularis]|uniref:uncharacterized protein LOC115417609 n=1 Tax=Sphaeramia orbicularis TaxID=375764 RepID=UPI001181531B|nr:uncharacterized protein LOC115417609 [Sphaeramia orbicularis]